MTHLEEAQRWREMYHREQSLRRMVEKKLARHVSTSNWMFFLFCLLAFIIWRA